LEKSKAAGEKIKFHSNERNWKTDGLHQKKI